MDLNNFDKQIKSTLEHLEGAVRSRFVASPRTSDEQPLFRGTACTGGAGGLGG